MTATPPSGTGSGPGTTAARNAPKQNTLPAIAEHDPNSSSTAAAAQPRRASDSEVLVHGAGAARADPETDVPGSGSSGDTTEEKAPQSGMTQAGAPGVSPTKSLSHGGTSSGTRFGSSSDTHGGAQVQQAQVAGASTAGQALKTQDDQPPQAPALVLPPTSSSSHSSSSTLPNTTRPPVPTIRATMAQQDERERMTQPPPSHPHVAVHAPPPQQGGHAPPQAHRQQAHHAPPPPHIYTHTPDNYHPGHGMPPPSAGLPEQMRYAEQGGYPTMAGHPGAVYPAQLYYDPAPMGAEYGVAPSHGPHPGYPPQRGSTVDGYSSQPVGSPFHPSATTPPVPQAPWNRSSITQPYYGSYGVMPPPGAQHAGQGAMPDDMGHGRGVYLGPAPPSGWSASPLISSPFQFFSPFHGSTPQVPQIDRIDNLSPVAEPWTPPPGQGRGGPSTAAGPPSVASYIAPHVTPAQASAAAAGNWSSLHPNQPTKRMSVSAPGGGEEGAKSSKPGLTAAQERAAERERKEYHPQPPARRSEWVMWVGNVPSNVSHEELWRFFNTTIPTPTTTAAVAAPAASEPWRGPSSIFLISRSSCAFVNFSSQADLDRAVPFFNGVSLRPWDPRCPRMVCRVRHKDDDLRAGVGAQRGVGMHRQWVEQQKGEKQRLISVSPKNSMLDIPDGDNNNSNGSSAHRSSASFASTNSSFLAHHFPKRFFILKSLSASDLEESVKSGLWKTQRHNQPILDQAFRTSQEVILIFGANRSGEFFGYAKMTAPSIPSKVPERQMTNTLRASFGSFAFTTSPSKKPAAGSSQSLSTSPGKVDEPAKRRSHQLSTPAPIRAIREEEDGESGQPERSVTDPYRLFLSPSGAIGPTRSPVMEDELGFSRLGITNEEEEAFMRSESPDMMEESLRRASAATLDPNFLRGDSRRFSSIRIAALEHSSSLQIPVSGPIRQQTTEPAETHIEQNPDLDGMAPAFRVQWVQVAPLNFSRTRHLRNPWNGDREVKVSRDGTEVEPNVGALLCAEWDKLQGETTTAKAGATGSSTGPTTGTTNTTASSPEKDS